MCFLKQLDCKAFMLNNKSVQIVVMKIRLQTFTLK